MESTPVLQPKSPSLQVPLLVTRTFAGCKENTENYNIQYTQVHTVKRSGLNPNPDSFTAH